MKYLKTLEQFINERSGIPPIELSKYRLSDEDSDITTIGEDYICETTWGRTCYVDKQAFEMWLRNRFAIRWKE